MPRAIPKNPPKARLSEAGLVCVAEDGALEATRLGEVACTHSVRFATVKGFQDRESTEVGESTRAGLGEIQTQICVSLGTGAVLGDAP